jgi:hypothetical protein
VCYKHKEIKGKKNINVDKEANSMDTELQTRRGWGEGGRETKIKTH